MAGAAFTAYAKIAAALCCCTATLPPKILLPITSRRLDFSTPGVTCYMMLRMSAHVISEFWRENDEEDDDEGDEVFRMSDYMKYVRGLRLFYVETFGSFL